MCHFLQFYENIMQNYVLNYRSDLRSITNKVYGKDCRWENQAFLAKQRNICTAQVLSRIWYLSHLPDSKAQQWQWHAKLVFCCPNWWGLAETYFKDNIPVYVKKTFYFLRLIRRLGMNFNFWQGKQSKQVTQSTWEWLRSKNMGDISI